MKTKAIEKLQEFLDANYLAEDGFCGVEYITKKLSGNCFEVTVKVVTTLDETKEITVRTFNFNDAYTAVDSYTRFLRLKADYAKGGVC